MPKVKTTNEDKKDSTIKDLISHVSRIETSLDGILSITKENKNKVNNQSSENNNSEQMGTILSKMDDSLESFNDYNKKVVDLLGQIRNALEKNNKSDLNTEKALRNGNKNGLFSNWFTKNKNEEENEQYGSIEKRDEKTKLLEKIAGNTAYKDKEQKEEKKEEKGGLLSKILGFAGKLLLPMLAGLLLSGLKPLVKNLISDLFGNEGILGDIGDFVGDAVADMLPGAAAGWLLTKTWRGALIGATISYGAARIRDIVNDITGMMNGEPREGAGELKGYEEKALAGALAGASLTGWKKGSFKAAMFGAGIGIAVEWLLNRANEIRAIIQGEEVEIKTIPGTGISEAVAGGLIGGAILGHQFGGWKGAAWGAVIGAIAGAVATVAADFNNRLQEAKEGKFQEPAEILGIPYPIFTGLIAGAAIGAKFGGPIGGLIGAAVGGIAGLIYNWGSNMFMRAKATEASGQTYIDEHLKDNKIINGANAQKDALDKEIEGITQEEAALKTKLENGEISQSEAMNQALALEAKKDQLKNKKGKVEDFDKDLKRRLGHVRGVEKADGSGMDTTALDADNDGRITKAEVAAWREREGVNSGGWLISPNAWGSKGRTARRVESLLEGKDSIAVEDLVEKTAERHLDTKSLPTANQITSEKTAKEQAKNTKELVAESQKTNEQLEMMNDNLVAIGNQQKPEEEDNNAYPNNTASGSGTRKRNP